jgi:hypothetical protein
MTRRLHIFGSLTCFHFVKSARFLHMTVHFFAQQQRLYTIFIAFDKVAMNLVQQVVVLSITSLKVFVPLQSTLGESITVKPTIVAITLLLHLSTKQQQFADM